MGPASLDSLRLRATFPRRHQAHPLGGSCPQAGLRECLFRAPKISLFPQTGGSELWGWPDGRHVCWGCWPGAEWSSFPEALQVHLGRWKEGPEEPEAGIVVPQGLGDKVLCGEDRDPAHTGAHHGRERTELQDSNFCLPSPESSLHGPRLMGVGWGGGGPGMPP